MIDIDLAQYLDIRKLLVNIPSFVFFNQEEALISNLIGCLVTLISNSKPWLISHHTVTFLLIILLISIMNFCEL